MDESQFYLDETSGELAGLINSTQEMLAILTLDGHFHRANHAWKQILGLDAADLAQSSIMDLIHSDDLWLVTQKVEFARKLKSPATFIARCQDKVGRGKCLRWHLSPAPDRPWIYLDACDITDQVTANDELSKSNEMLTSV